MSYRVVTNAASTCPIEACTKWYWADLASPQVVIENNIQGQYRVCVVCKNIVEGTELPNNDVKLRHVNILIHPDVQPRVQLKDVIFDMHRMLEKTTPMASVQACVKHGGRIVPYWYDLLDIRYDEEKNCVVIDMEVAQ